MQTVYKKTLWGKGITPEAVRRISAKALEDDDRFAPVEPEPVIEAAPPKPAPKPRRGGRAVRIGDLTFPSKREACRRFRMSSNAMAISIHRGYAVFGVRVSAEYIDAATVERIESGLTDAQT